MKVKDIKKFLKRFDDNDNVFIECCIDEKAKNGTYKNEIINNEPFEVELCNYDLDDDDCVELMFSVKEYK